MNRKLDSELKTMNPFKAAQVSVDTLASKDNFSDLVPSFVTVESAYLLGGPSFQSIQSHDSKILNAVMIPVAGKLLEQYRVGGIGVAMCYTATVTFLKLLSHKLAPQICKV